MQQLTHILFQMDEALRYIDDGRMERLRLALLLLDTAAELQIDRRVRDELVIENWNERTRQQTLLLASLLPEGSQEIRYRPGRCIRRRVGLAPCRRHSGAMRPQVERFATRPLLGRNVLTVRSGLHPPSELSGTPRTPTGWPSSACQMNQPSLAATKSMG